MAQLQYQYYYGSDAENFNFFRLPKKLIRDKQFRTISSDAKLLYGLLLDRMTLSQKNRWLDEEGRIYIIYTIEEIAAELYCSQRKAIQLMNELNGIGLIKRKRQGMGRPNLIYVMNFNAGDAFNTEDERKSQESDPGIDAGFQEVQEYAYQEVNKCAFQEVQEHAHQEVNKCAFQEVQEHAHQEVNKHTLQEAQNLAPQNDTNINDTNSIYNNLSIYLSEAPSLSSSTVPEEGRMDRQQIANILKRKIGYHYLINDSPEDSEQIREILELLADVCCETEQSAVINGNRIHIRDVRQRMMSLKMEHIRYVLHCLKQNTGKIKNIRGYLLTCLYNAPVTIKSYYQAAVQHDLIHSGKE